MPRNYVKEWGESGSLRPYLVPDAASMEKLREVQDELIEQMAPSQPLIKKVEDLHATVFYLKPVELYNYLRENVNPKINRAALYEQLMSAASMLLVFHDPSETEVRVERMLAVGEDHSTAALSLNPTDFDEASFSTRDEIQYILRTFGVTDAVANAMTQDERFRWLAGHSLPHISLATGLQGISFMPYQPGPFTIKFIPEVGVGSATAGPTDTGTRVWWPLRGIPGDPMLKRMGKDPDVFLPKAEEN